jgi:hypothetical protein
VDTINSGSATSYNFTHVRRNHTIEAHFNNVLGVHTNIRNGWNLVSVPVVVSDFAKRSIYPTSISNAFAYQSGYVFDSTLGNGAAYWLKFDSAQTVSESGILLILDSIDVVQGWNLIGSISSPVATSSIGSIPGGIVTSQYFGYSGSYKARDTVEPGKGYWVKVDQAGKLILSVTAGNIPSGNLAHIRPTSELPPSPPSGGSKESPLPMPEEFGLEQNYPNPFNPTTVIRYDLPVDAHVELKVYNMLGQEVATLVDETQSAGFKSVVWDASRMGSGVYYYRITAGSFNSVRKMILVK